MVSLVVALCLVGAPEHDLSRARALIVEELRYEAGIALLEQFLVDPGRAAEDRVVAYRLLGTAYVAKNAPKAAEAAFAALLALDPDHTLDPRLSPKIHYVFDRAKKRTLIPVRLTDVAASPRAGALTVTARVADPQARLDHVVLYARTAGKAFVARRMQRRAETLSASVRLPKTEKVHVDYFLVAFDGQGRPLAEAGSRQAPSSAVVQRSPFAPMPEAAPAEDPWYRQWWVWALTAAVVGGVVTAVIVLSETSNDPPQGTLEPIVLDP